MKQVKNEISNGDSDDDIPISAISKGKKKVEYSDDDEAPLAFSRAKMKSAVSVDFEESKKVVQKGNAMVSKVKKEESGGSKVTLKQDMEKKVKKVEIKKVNIKEKDKKASSSGTVKKEKAKKVYDLPGQKHDPPEERDSLRIFYESLYDQNPNSEMAQVWMMERGLLPVDKAKKVFEKKKQKGIASPAKPTPTKKSPAASSVKRSLDTSSTKKGKAGTSKDNPAKNKRRKADSDSEEDSDDDFIAPAKQNPRKKQKISN